MRVDRDVAALAETLTWVERGASALAAVCTLALVVYLLWPTPCDPDPWACFGAGRYDAMREGRVCECYQKEHLND